MKSSKIFNLLTFLFLLTLPQIGLAHPPTNIELEYVAASETLRVKVKHVSREARDHYIKKITISQNGSEITSNNYRQQVTPSYFRKEFSVSAKEGDTLTVLANCSEGGSYEASLSITKEVLNAEASEEYQSSNARPAHPRDPNKIKPAVPKDPKISKPMHPTNPKKYKPAVARSGKSVKPAISNDPKIAKPAVSSDPNVSVATHPNDSSKYKPANP